MRLRALLVSLALATSGCASVVIFDQDLGRRSGIPDAQRELSSVPPPPREAVSELGRLDQVGVNGFVLDPLDDGTLPQGFAFDEATPVFREGEAVSHESLQPGTEVRVTYRPTAKAPTHADRIEIVEIVGAAGGP